MSALERGLAEPLRGPRLCYIEPRLNHLSAIDTETLHAQGKVQEDTIALSVTSIRVDLRGVWLRHPILCRSTTGAQRSNTQYIVLHCLGPLCKPAEVADLPLTLQATCGPAPWLDQQS